MAGVLTSLSLGFFYFVGAIPAGVAAHAPLWIAALAAWLGYCAGGLVILVAGAPLRSWMTRKLKINPTPNPSKFFWRIWHRFGLWGLAFVAPVSVGPQTTAILSLALGESPKRILLAIAVGIIPWVVLSGYLTSVVFHFWK